MPNIIQGPDFNSFTQGINRQGGAQSGVSGAFGKLFSSLPSVVAGQSGILGALVSTAQFAVNFFAAIGSSVMESAGKEMHQTVSQSPPGTMASTANRVGLKALPGAVNEGAEKPSLRERVGSAVRAAFSRLSTEFSKLGSMVKMAARHEIGDAKRGIQDVVGKIETKASSALHSIKEAGKSEKFAYLLKGIDDQIGVTKVKLEKETAAMNAISDKTSVEYTDAERTVSKLGERLDKFEALKQLVQKDPKGVEKQLSQAAGAVKEAGTIAQSSLEKMPGMTGKVTGGLKELAAGMPHSEEMIASCDSTYASVTGAVSREQESVKSEMEKPGVRTLFETYTMEDGQLTPRPVDTMALLRPMIGEVSAKTAVDLPDLCEKFEKTMIRGGILDGVYGQGLPKYPVGGGSFSEGELETIGNYFNGRTDNAELAEGLKDAYVGLNAAYNGRGSNQTRYVEAAAQFVGLWKQLPT